MAAGLNNRGIVLFTVLAVIFIAVILANVILALVSSHTRLTHHQVSRIQAYYAAQAGVNYAQEKLRKGEWKVFYENQKNQTNCYVSPCVVTDASFPPQIKSVNISITPAGELYPGRAGTSNDDWCSNPTLESSNTTGLFNCIDVTVDYSYP